MGFLPAKVPFHSPELRWNNFTCPMTKAHGQLLDPKLDQLLALANGYNDDPRFKANFDKMHPQLAEFLREAVEVYVANRKK